MIHYNHSIYDTCVLYSTKVPDAAKYIFTLAVFFMANMLSLLICCS